MLHESDVIQEFHSAMAEHGVVVALGDIEADGKLHRIDVDGDKRGTKNGWYVLHADEYPRGEFGCNRRFGNDHKIKWSAKAPARPLTPDEKRAYREKMDRQRAAREAETAARREAAAALANRLWNEAKPADEHPYLTRKQIKAHGLRVGKWEKVRDSGEVYLISPHALLVPLYGLGKKLMGLQAILPKKLLDDGTRDKDYSKDVAKEGLFFPIGKPLTVDGKQVIIICEGYATGASIHEATGHAVIVAFDAPNLLPVARVIRAKFADATILFAADNDQWTVRPVVNPGLTRAREAAAEVGGLVALPEFDTSLGVVGEKGGPTDFNDLQLARGADEVRATIEAALNPPPPRDEEPDEPPIDEPPADEAPPLPWEGEPSFPQASAAPEPARAAHDDDGDDDDEPGGKPEDNGYFTILGYDHGTYFIFLHGKKQIHACTKSDFSEAGLIELAPVQWWEMNFHGKDPGSINKKAAANFIIRTAEKRGIYDIERLRGRGAWWDAGRVVYHHGLVLTVDGVETDVTRIKSHYVYEAAKPLPMPARDALTDEEGHKILSIAEMFRWTKPGSAALLAGWVMLAPVCGALNWRPHLWLTGGAGSGKSTVLGKFVHGLLAGTDVFAQGNSTEAGIRQKLRADARPVLFDEAEKNNERERSRVDMILSLIRQSSTEGDAETLKGTADGGGMSFFIRSMFCLASIQVGLEHKADIDRLTVLSLRSRDQHAPAAVEDHSWNAIKDALYELTRDNRYALRLLRRALDLLPTILKNIEVFVEVAAEKFGSQRDGDQYGTMLAGAWSLTSREVASRADASALIDRYDWSEHVEKADANESQLALTALMESHIRLPGGDVSVFELVQAASGQSPEGVDLPFNKADAVLQRYGMRVKGDRLLLSNQSQELKKLMATSPFGADLRGMLLRVPGSDRYDNRSIKFSGVASKCISLPLDPILFDPDRPPI